VADVPSGPSLDSAPNYAEKKSLVRQTTVAVPRAVSNRTIWNVASELSLLTLAFLAVDVIR
jgi:hypothetical protein